MKKIKPHLLTLLTLALLTTCTHDNYIKLEPLAGVSLEIMGNQTKSSLPDSFTATVEIYKSEELRKSSSVNFVRNELGNLHLASGSLEVPVGMEIALSISVDIEGVFWSGSSQPFSVIEGETPHLISIIIRDENNPNIPVVTTHGVSGITQHTAISGGEVIDDGGFEVTTRGLVWSTQLEPTLEENDGFSVEEIGTGEFISMATVLPAETQFYVRAYATNEHGTAYGYAQQFTTTPMIVYGDGVTDIDGNTYTSVIIGYQEWMAENLRVTSYRNGDAILTDIDGIDWETTTDGAFGIYPHAQIDGLNSEQEVMEAYGILYNWYAVDDPRSLCPDGWHVPSYQEWLDFHSFIFDNTNHLIDNIANVIKTCRQVNSPLGGACLTNEHPRWDENAVHYGTDEYGFSALPSGRRYATDNIAYIGNHTNWWASTDISELDADIIGIYDYDGDLKMLQYPKLRGVSIRCIKD